MNGEYSKWKIAGQNFYNQHHVDLVRRFDGQREVFNIFNIEAFGNFTSSVPEFGYKIAPVVLLIFGGYVLYNVKTPRRETTESAVAIGATIMTGYLIFAVVGRYLFVLSSEGFRSYPEFTGSVLILGIIYPAVFGAIGAIIGQSA